MNDKLEVRNILTKLGEAIYMHKAMVKQAERAKEAVEYLADKGVLDFTVSKTVGKSE